MFFGAGEVTDGKKGFAPGEDAVIDDRVRVPGRIEERFGRVLLQVEIPESPKEENAVCPRKSTVNEGPERCKISCGKIHYEVVRIVIHPCEEFSCIFEDDRSLSPGDGSCEKT